MKNSTKRKRMSMLLVLCMTGVLIAGCGKKNSTTGAENKTTEKTQQTNTNPTDEQKVFESLFDINNPVSIQISISDKELLKLQDDYNEYNSKKSKSPIYRKADKVTITIGDEVYEIDEVGIRLKGNTSRVPVYDEYGNPNLSHYKLSFNETFDDPDYYGDDAETWSSDEEKQARKDRTFATLKGLEMKWNKNYDNSYIREYYAYSMYRDMGILAQHVNLCSTGLNGENYGVFNIYEPVDKTFIEKNLPEEDWGGDLYKCGWTYKPCNYVKSTVTYGIEDADSSKFYNYDLKTNKKDSKNESLENLLNVVSKSDFTKEEFSKVVDTDYFVKFLATSYFAGNPDDIRNNYNNHYVYFKKSTGQAIFIPYDYDRCFGITFSWNPDGTGMTAPSPFSEKAEGKKGNQTNPMIKKSILKDGFFIDEYKTALANVAKSKWMTEDNFEEYYNLAKQNYETVLKPTIKFANAIPDNFKFSLEGTYTEEEDANMSFAEYVKRIMETYNAAIQ